MGKPKSARGEMPFLDHLEELRWRILWSLIALVAGSVVGFYAVQHFDVLAVLKIPIAPYLPDGKLFVTRPADAFIITLKLAVVVGAVLASPVIIAQVWRFLAPALYEHEKRYIVPVLLAGLGLFVAGVTMAYFWVLPFAFRVLSRFQYDYLEWIITAEAYFSFATHLMLAFGLMFQLPIVMVLLGVFDVIRPETFARQRPIALVIGSVAAALLTPGPDVFSMMMMLAPILVLYESGILIARLVRRRRRRTIGTALVLALACLAPGRAAEAQEIPRPRPREAVRDSAARQDSVVPAVDTSAARKLGLPTAPARQFPTADSVLRELMDREGYVVTRYAADSITLFGRDREVTLRGSALVEREGSTLEARRVRFQEADCRLLAEGAPALFSEGTVLVGEDMRYDTCRRIGTVPSALTSFEQSGVTWYLRGGLEMDSASVRVYGRSNRITSSEELMPDYHIATGTVKWVNNTIMVARPAVLYVRDVPVLWLPFIFQDMRRGRRSGMLVPRFGFNDIVRPNDDYRRHISNIGYYVVLNDYLDVQASLDWFAETYVSLNGEVRYRWLDRFLNGGLAVSRIFEAGAEGKPGSRALRLQWTHQQSFNQRTRLSANVDYTSSTRVLEQNSVDPFLQTATLSSRINFSKQFGWGTLSLGGSRSQDLSNNTTQQSLPTLSLTPSPIQIASGVTWSPAFSLNNQQTFDQRGSRFLVPRPAVGGSAAYDTVLTDSRNTTMSVQTPLRVGRWNWANSISVTDTRSIGPPSAVVLPDSASPTDSVTRYYSDTFRTDVDWNTSINLPILFPATWKLQPTLGVMNTTSGAFLVRTPYSHGNFVAQGKRFSLSVGVSPTLFGFFPGVGPIARIRHAVYPRLSWSYAPSAEVPEAYARAIDPTGRTVGRRSPVVQSLTFGLSQTFEGKYRPAPGDTTDQAQARKVKLLAIQTSSIGFDIEQAKQEGRNGWTTQTLSNQFTSDLLPGFTLGIAHDLWDGPVGYDTTRFDPFLTSMSARFSLSAATVRGLVRLLSGRPGTTATEEPADTVVPGVQDLSAQDPVYPPGTGLARGGRSAEAQLPQGRGFQASFTYDDSRRRPRSSGEGTVTQAPANRTLGLSVSFSPTPNWQVAWNTQYNLTLGQFGQHVLRLQRQLNRWRATFAFLQAPNGNFAFNFFISLSDLPELKFNYDQRTVR